VALEHSVMVIGEYGKKFLKQEILLVKLIGTRLKHIKKRLKI
jgi:hypothetical protein